MPFIRWLFNIQPLWNAPDEFDAALILLPSPLHPTIGRYHRLNDRKLALASQLLQHLIVHLHRHVPLNSILLSRAGGLAGGRPVYLGDVEKGIPGLDYNVSHHGSLVALVSRLLPPDDKVKGSIGVDIAYATQRPVYIKGGMKDILEWVEGFAHDIFTDNEMDIIRRSKTEEGVVMGLYKNWALKEAYVKAMGTGLVTDLLGVEFRGVEGWTGEEGGKKTDVEAWIGKGTGRSRIKEWWTEIERVQVVGEEAYFVAVASRKEGMAEEDEKGHWKWMEWDKDVKILF